MRLIAPEVNEAMLRKLQAFLVPWAVLGVGSASAEELTDEAPVSDDTSFQGSAEAPADPLPESPPESPPAEPSAEADVSASASLGSATVDDSADFEAGAPRPSNPEVVEPGAPAAESSGWDTFLSGYFRAPMAIGISPRPSPDDIDGPSHLQLSYGPNRTVDANYYSFAYTRLQEQDWAEIFIHAKKPHAEAVVGWMGYWFQSAGFRNYDAGWVPGMAYLTLDTDFEVGGMEPNIALTAGAWWPKFGTFDKYDTYTLGRFRQLGEQLKLTLPLSEDIEATLVQGFGTSRDGVFNVVSPPPYQATTGIDLIHYEHVAVRYKDIVEVGLHYNTQWTRDPNLFRTVVAGKAFTDAREADLTTIGGEVTVSVPYAGSLWVSPSYITVNNGWALGEAGVEVMHSLSAEGLATNYMGWSGSLPDSTGSGKMLNLGFLYENSLSNIQGKARGSVPDVTLNVFGLFADTQLDKPEGSSIGHDRIGQFKYGADVELQALDWLAVMLRWDEVNYDLGSPGYVFSAISPRVTFSSHFLSGESIYIQYSRYRYGDRMVLRGDWPWGTPLIAGSDIVQGGPYAGETPDMDVIRLQASIAF